MTDFRFVGGADAQFNDIGAHNGASAVDRRMDSYRTLSLILNSSVFFAPRLTDLGSHRKHSVPTAEMVYSTVNKQ